MSLAHAYVAVRTLVTVTEEGGSYQAPQIPATWDLRREGDSGLWTIYTQQGELLVAGEVNAIGTNGLFVVWGPRDRLDEIAANRSDVMPGREAWRRGYDLTSAQLSDGIDAGEVLGPNQDPTARQILRAWRWWVCDVWEMEEGAPVHSINVRRQLSAPGVMLPNLNTTPLPWDLDESGNIVPQAQAVRRVTRLVHPTYTGTEFRDDAQNWMMGLVVEEEPERT